MWPPKPKIIPVPHRLRFFFNFLAYTIASTAGYAVYFGVMIPVHLVARQFSRTSAGRHSFELLSRVRWSLYVVLCSAALGAVVPFVYFPPSAAMALSIVAILLPIILSTYQGRVLSVSCRGSGNWTVHLNRLVASTGGENRQWTGVFEELEQVVHIACKARIRTLQFKSPLLVPDRTANLLERKLQRAFLKHGQKIDVATRAPVPSGVLLSGINHVLFRHHFGLKAHRRAFRAPLNRMTREMKVEISSGTRSSAGFKALASEEEKNNGR